MSALSIGLGFLIGVIVTILVGGARMFDRQRKGSLRHIDALEINSMAEKLGVEVDLDSIGKSSDGDRLLSAIGNCNTCQSVDKCHAFLEVNSAEPGSITSFCPQAIYLLGLAAKQERDAQKSQTV